MTSLYFQMVCSTVHCSFSAISA